MSWFMRQVYLAIERVLALRTQGIIAVSPEEERAATFIGLGGAKIRTIPNGLDQLDLASRESARRAMGVNEGEIVVGFVGRLVEQKAPEVLIKAFANVSIAVPNARLAMVGDGPLFDHLVELSGQLGISQKVVWLGESDARQFFGGFDLFALPSRKEGLPYVILEAMATGLPVVATSSAGVEILIEPGINGLVVPPDDAGAFGEALVHLLQTPDLLTRYGAASLRLIRRFPIDRMVENTLSFYRSSASAPAHAEFETEEMAAV
jgi:glycosyltransferase involved in cell wall biosynthesis